MVLRLVLGLRFSCALIEFGGCCCKSTCLFLHVQSCFGLERAEGRFWELLPTGEGALSVLLAHAHAVIIVEVHGVFAVQGLALASVNSSSRRSSL